MATFFDANEYARQLEAAGVPKDQAQILADGLSSAVSHCLAVRSDLSIQDRYSYREIDQTRVVGRIDAVQAHIDTLEMRTSANFQIAETMNASRAALLISSVEGESAVLKLLGAVIFGLLLIFYVFA